MNRLYPLALASFLALGVPAHAATQSELANLKGPDRQKTLEDAAKKEGAVAIYAALGVEEGLGPILEAFGKKYPAIKTSYWRGSAREILQKVLVERQANGLVADVMEGGGLAVISIQAGVIEPFYSVSLEEHPKSLYDPQGRYAATRVAYYGSIYNSKTVAAADAPKSYDDLLDPKWHEKIVWRAGDESGALMFITNTLIARGDAAGEAYLQKLSAQKIVNYSSSARAMVDRVGQGEYPVAVNVSLDLPVDAMRKGAPIAVKLLEPVASTSNTIQLVKGAPHPASAMLLIDFMLGREGQGILAQRGFFVPNPNVEPKAEMKQVLPRLQGVKETDISPAQMFDRREKATAIYEKLFNN
jgi:ABC-type Fe3+ transport system substrate-binding protein